MYTCTPTYILNNNEKMLINMYVISKLVSSSYLNLVRIYDIFPGDTRISSGNIICIVCYVMHMLNVSEVSEVCTKMGLSEEPLDENTDPPIAILSQSSNTISVLLQGESYTGSEVDTPLTFSIVAEKEIYVSSYALTLTGKIVTIKTEFIDIDGKVVAQVS